MINFISSFPLQLHTVRGKGTVLRASLSDDVTPENVRDAWAKVTDMSGAEHLNSITEATGSLVEILDSLEAPANASANPSDDYSDTFAFNNKDLVLYALGGGWSEVGGSLWIKTIIFIWLSVGATVKDSIDLKFLYENHPDFAPLPSYFIQPGLLLQMSTDLVGSALKHTELNLSQVLHGEQYLEVIGDLPTEGQLKTTGVVVDVCDKKSGAVVVTNCAYTKFNN